MKKFARIRKGIAAAGLICFSTVFVLTGVFAQNAQPSVVVFSNVHIYDGKSNKVSALSFVQVRGNVIERISATPIPTERQEGTTLIDGGGRTLMPGLIDNHWHVMFAAIPIMVLMTSNPGYVNLLAAREAENTLMRGFTTVRDLGGPSFDLKRAIDEGIVVGPRIYPSGAVITITGGHGDFRQPYELPRTLGSPESHIEQLGGAMIADNPDEVRLRAREQLMLGATQVKLTAGGGVASPHSPLDVSTFTEPELRAAVEAAENWGTYVTVHAYTPQAISRAIKAGVKCIEHGHLMDEATAQLIAEKGIWLSTQPFIDDPQSIPFPPGSEQYAKKMMVIKGTDVVYTLAKKYKIKTAFGTDILFDAREATRQASRISVLTRWFTPAEILKMVTATNAELLTLCGLRNPYPGKLGIVEEGALADLLLVDGDPLADIHLLDDPAKNLLVIMKDGKVFKDITQKPK